MANSLIGRDLAVDLGSANALVYVRGRGVLIDEPSLLAVDAATGELRGIGHEARRLSLRTPDALTQIRPIRDGVIADFEATEQLLRYFLQRVHRRRYLAKPRMVICVPSGTTAVERRVVREAGYQAGARRVFVIEAPIAAALGAGLPVHEATGHLVVDIGAGTTEVAVISLGGIVTARTVRIAGEELDRALVSWLRKEHSLVVGERAAEEIKTTFGSAYPHREECGAELRGRDLVSGRPRTVDVSAADVRRALDEPLRGITEAVLATLDQTPPELARDITDRGIALTGGGALLRGMAERLGDETGLPVHVADDPLTSVAMGAGRCIDAFDALQPLLVPQRGRVA